MSANASVKPGDVLAGKYRVERILGAGGMGYVVAARHLQLDQLVAMKFLRRGVVDNAEATARFLREAKAVVKLHNEHIAKVFDVGTMETGEPYIVMEHLEGCDLSVLSKHRHAIPTEEACEYVIQACEALAEAHSLGIIHRDIKLANLFVTRGPAGTPLVKVLDFGISKTNPFGESEHDMTRTASMLGSPRFMSPEQMRDPRAVDARSDIWSLGVVLYRLIAGHPPFEAETLGRLLTMVMHEQEPPISSVRRDIPPGFDEVLARCLQKDPAMRFANVAELAYALVPFAVEPVRAHAVADRIAAVLSLRPLTTTGDISIPISLASGRVSAPPGVTDTGTAAPWAGTGSRSIPGAWNTTAWLGVGLASILVGSGIFAFIRHDSRAAAPRAPSVQSQVPPTVAAPLTTATAVQTAGFAEHAPSSETPPPVPTIIGASPMAPPTGTAPRVDPSPPPRRAAPGPPPRIKSGSQRSIVAAPAPPPRNDDGIPTTRD